MTGIALLMAQGAMAKKTTVPHMYMFGLAASFSDTIVHFTDIQEMDSVWIESKNGFILGRDQYSSQLRNYLTTAYEMPYRTCVVFYNKNRAKLVKKLQKMKKLYSPGKDGLQHFDVRQLEPDEFRFIRLDMSDPVEVTEE